MPVQGARFPVPGRRERAGNLARRKTNPRPERPSKAPHWRRSPCTFPTDQGIGPQRRVRSGLPPPPCSPPVRRLPPASVRSRQITRLFAGFWATGQGVSEPETAPTGGSSRHPRESSPWAISAVRLAPVAPVARRALNPVVLATRTGDDPKEAGVSRTNRLGH